MRKIGLLLVLITTIISHDLSVAQELETEGFNLIVVGDPQPQTEAQFAELESLVEQMGVYVDQYKSSGYPTAILLTGDVVWDSMELLPRVKALFEGLNVPVYAVIGNHDHDRQSPHNERIAESQYEQVFGPRYYHFTLGCTEFFALDNISYRAYEKYSIRVNNKQLRWLKRQAKSIDPESRIAIAMHAPAVDFRGNKRPYSYTKRIMRIFDGHRIDFITGHRHRHATVDIEEGVVEHNVAQVNGNLWYAPICSDGTPRSVFCIEERNDEWTWHYDILNSDDNSCIVAWDEGEAYGHEQSIIVKVIGWDDKWHIKWIENGTPMGEMEQLEITDPDYMRYIEEEADYGEIYMARLRRSAAPHSHYFSCKRTVPNSQITIIATDRFGNTHTVTLD